MGLIDNRRALGIRWLPGMARLLRVQFPGAIYHVSARGNERRLIFGDDQDRERFLQNLAEAQHLYRPRLYLVCRIIFTCCWKRLPAI